MQKITPELIEYFNSLEELHSTAEVIAEGDEYIVIHVNKDTWNESNYHRKLHWGAQ
jgi:hypothetical protein